MNFRHLSHISESGFFRTEGERTGGRHPGEKVIKNILNSNDPEVP